MTGDEALGHLPMVRRIATAAARKLPAGVLDVDDLIAAGTVGLLEAATRWDPDRGPFCAYAHWRIRGAIRDEMRRLDWVPNWERRRMTRAGERPTMRQVPLTADVDLPAVEADPTPVVALDRLSSRQRSVIDAIYAHGQSGQAVARSLGVSGGRVSQIHHEALRALRGADTRCSR